MAQVSPRRLVVIPSDSLDDYVAMGWGDNLRDYFNPQGAFDEVTVVSPLETGRRHEFGMTIAGTDARSFRATRSSRVLRRFSSRRRSRKTFLST